MQEAKLTELCKEGDTLRDELKCATDTVNVLALSLIAAEEFVRASPNSVLTAFRRCVCLDRQPRRQFGSEE